MYKYWAFPLVGLDNFFFGSWDLRLWLWTGVGVSTLVLCLIIEMGFCLAGSKQVTRLDDYGWKLTVVLLKTL